MKFDEIKFRRDIILGKAVLTYKDKLLECVYKEFTPFMFYKTCRVHDIYDNKEYKYVLLQRVSGEFLFSSPENEVTFSCAAEAFAALDKVRKYDKKDREYILGLLFFCVLVKKRLSCTKIIVNNGLNIHKINK